VVAGRFGSVELVFSLDLVVGCFLGMCIVCVLISQGFDPISVPAPRLVFEPS
jgi:hypothetical protein